MSAQPLQAHEIVRLVRGYLEEDAYIPAMELLEMLEVSPVHSPMLYYYRAMIAMKLERWSEALDILEQLLEFEPTRAVLHLDRAWCWIELGLEEQARSALCSETSPIGHRAPRYVFLARIAARAGDLAETRRQLAVAYALDPLIADFVDEFDELKVALSA